MARFTGCLSVTRAATGTNIEKQRWPRQLVDQHALSRPDVAGCLAIFYRRYADPRGPWTPDPILKAYRFTDAYRAADRVSQYLIREVQARPDRPQTAREIFF